MLELKTVVSSVMRKLRVESVIPRAELKLIGEIDLKNQGGNIVKVFPRCK